MLSAHVHRACGIAALTVFAGYGCMTSNRPAPVSDRAHQPSSAPAPVVTRPAPAVPAAVGSVEPDLRPDFYTVKKGDTLALIALDHGLDYRDLAAWNNIENPNMIRIGQQLTLRAPAATGVVTAPLKAEPKIEGRPVGSAPAATASGAVKSQPKAVKLPYSDQALAQLSEPAVIKPPVIAVAPPVAAPPVAPPVAKVDPRPEQKPSASEDEENVDWAWPASGKVLSGFNESTNLKGIGIAGKAGQSVLASAPGKVLYSGDGIRGYGKLVIIKHNKAYISVYAHNQQLLVKEGQSVVKGQKIADMGSSDSDQVKLHFEIRRFGKPVDPLKLLPAERQS
jgi:lipoprotein NlpD